MLFHSLSVFLSFSLSVQTNFRMLRMNSRDRESIKGAREVEREINLDRGGGASAPSFITARYSGTESTD